MLRNMTSIFISRGEEVLMLYRVGSRAIEPSWVGIGGHMEPEEIHDPQACVLRELSEEVGLTGEDLEGLTLRYVSLRHNGKELRQNFYFFAELKGEKRDLPCSEGTLAWVKWDKVPELHMPVTARNALEHYLAVGRYDTKIYGVVTGADMRATVIPLTEEDR